MRFFLLLVALTLTTSCGLKGPLYLPDEEPSQEVPIESQTESNQADLSEIETDNTEDENIEANLDSDESESLDVTDSKEDE